MLKGAVLHPEILSALAAAGHGGKLLISDGNYPHNTKPNPRAKLVFANFAPGLVDAATLLRLVCSLVPIERVEVMATEKTGAYAMKEDPPIWSSYRKVLKEHSDFAGDLTPLEKPAFNRAAREEDVCLVIASGETQIYANLLITIGVVSPR